LQRSSITFTDPPKPVDEYVDEMNSDVLPAQNVMAPIKNLEELAVDQPHSG